MGSDRWSSSSRPRRATTTRPGTAAVGDTDGPGTTTEKSARPAGPLHPRLPGTSPHRSPLCQPDAVPPRHREEEPKCPKSNAPIPTPSDDGTSETSFLPTTGRESRRDAVSGPNHDYGAYSQLTEFGERAEELPRYPGSPDAPPSFRTQDPQYAPSSVGAAALDALAPRDTVSHRGPP